MKVMRVAILCLWRIVQKATATATATATDKAFSRSFQHHQMAVAVILFSLIDKMQKNFHASNLLLLPIISRLVYNFAYIVPSLELCCISFHLTGDSKAIFPKI
ncbi:hypothetical protein QOT17_015677 [Balamuthia mandrillaris]